MCRETSQCSTFDERKEIKENDFWWYEITVLTWSFLCNSKYVAMYDWVWPSLVSWGYTFKNIKSWRTDNENDWMEVWEQAWIGVDKFPYSYLHCWCLINGNAKSNHYTEHYQNYCLTFGFLCIHPCLRAFSEIWKWPNRDANNIFIK